MAAEVSLSVFCYLSGAITSQGHQLKGFNQEVLKMSVRHTHTRVGLLCENAVRDVNVKKIHTCRGHGSMS